MRSEMGDGVVRVVYISAWGRSGTTIIDRVLGQLPGFCSVGELRSLWDCDPATHCCSCGQLIADCEIWGPSLTSVLGGATSSEFSLMRALRDRAGRSRDVPLHWASSVFRRPSRVVTTEYGDRVESLYRQVANRSGAHTVVDSSKHPSEALFLARRTGIDMNLLHMVRDPRGVAYSWTRSGERHGRAGDAPPTRGALSSAAWWTTWNLAIEWALAPGLGRQYRRIRYEDIMDAPRRGISEVATWAGGDAQSINFLDDDEVMLEPAHLVAGNPNRTTAGQVRLQVDLDWESRLPRSDKWKSTLGALPMLPHYRYPVFS